MCFFSASAATREISLSVKSDPGPLLIQMQPREIGVAWTNSVPVAKYLERQNLMNGAGVALGDYDGDGNCDVFLCNRFGPSALLRNLGQWRFEDVAARAGVACSNQISTGAVFADMDGDGKLDLLVSSFLGPNAYFRNLGNGGFSDLTEKAALKSPGGTTSQALSDLDGDGDLDLYVNYFAIEALLRDGVSISTRLVRGQPVVIGRFAKRLKIVSGIIMELGEPDMVYRNNSGRFTPLNWEEVFVDENDQPASPPLDFGLAVQIRDIDLDGDPDIYTCNDFQTPDRLWLNSGNGRFKAAPELALRNRSFASMGGDFADIDRDGDFDFITVEMLSRDRERHLRQSSPMRPVARTLGEFEQREDVARNGLYINRGDGTYAETAWFSGVAASDWSWTPIFLDIDLDGFEDLLISNGHLHDVNDRDTMKRASGLQSDAKREFLREHPRLDVANAAYRNRGDLTFEEVSEAWGFNSKQITHGMALGDLDNDGDLDVVGNCVNAAPLFYKNNSAAPRIAVRLRGRAPNTHGIGGRVALTSGGLQQMQEVLAGGRYVSSDEPLRVFALPKAGANTLEVIWRDGKRSQITGVKANTLYEIDEATAAPAPAVVEAKSDSKEWFEDVSSRLNHKHAEVAFDDFARQPLLPRRYSQLGPGVAWLDLTGDGFDELIVGAARGSPPSGFQNDGKGGFTRLDLGAKALPDDTAALAGISINGQPAIVTALSHYESGQPSPLHLFSPTHPPKTIAAALPDNSSPGPLAVTDIDGDGDLDLFVGGRIVPGNYPESAASVLYRNENGAFVKDEIASKLIRTGMITAAIFSDLNDDGFPELLTAEEWGPIRIYGNALGQLTDPYEPDPRYGWWNSITMGDMNNDGKLDIIAGNWGRNSHYERGRAGGRWMIYYGDLEPGAQGELIECYEERGVVPVRDLQTLSASMPSLATVFPTHAAFATARLETALADRFARAKVVTASTLDSMLFMNEGANGFRPQTLPAEAQWAPVFGLNIADFDNDGTNDLFIAQNFFAVRPEDDRLDAGRGLLLRGESSGKLVPVPGQVSGIRIYGEQRGSAVSDFDNDGRLDLVVTQNAGETKLYRNTQAAPGLRVRLKGPTQNPFACGAVLRGRTTGGWSAARAIHGGSGYWSQDSAIQVFPGGTKDLTIRWPGGKQTVTQVPAGAREISIALDGACSVLK